MTDGIKKHLSKIPTSSLEFLLQYYKQEHLRENYEFAISCITQELKSRDETAEG